MYLFPCFQTKHTAMCVDNGQCAHGMAISGPLFLLDYKPQKGRLGRHLTEPNVIQVQLRVSD